MNRILVKNEIKQGILGNIKSVFAGTLLALIVVSSTVISIRDSTSIDVMSTGYSFSSIFTFVGIFSSIGIAALSLLGLQIARREKSFDKLTVNDSFTRVNTLEDIIDILLINLLIGLYTFFWALLFIIPGIVKAYSYSQAIYIFMDEKYKNGNKIGYNEAITRSRLLMNGNKTELFVINISFMGWNALGGMFVGSAFGSMNSGLLFLGIPFLSLLLGFAILWFAVVYQNFTNAYFYNYLRTKHISELY